MRTIQHTTDGRLIKDILARENVYDSLVYDDSLPLADYTLTGVWFILVEDEAVAGLINLVPLNNIMWQPHIFIFESHRGKGSEQWGKLAAEYMREHCGTKKFLALTPYMSAKRYAERMGFTYVTTLGRSIKKNGQLLKQHMLEME